MPPKFERPEKIHNKQQNICSDNLPEVLGVNHSFKTLLQQLNIFNLYFNISTKTFQDFQVFSKIL
jgi:hypothetical protein